MYICTFIYIYMRNQICVHIYISRYVYIYIHINSYISRYLLVTKYVLPLHCRCDSKMLDEVSLSGGSKTNHRNYYRLGNPLNTEW